MITFAANTTSEFDVGTIATHLCDSGFALVGSMNRTCVDDNQEDIVGVWSESAPTCEGKDLINRAFPFHCQFCMCYK